MGCSLESLYNSWVFGRIHWPLFMFFFFFFGCNVSLSGVSNPSARNETSHSASFSPVSFSLSLLVVGVCGFAEKKNIDCKLCRDYLLPELLDSLCSCNFSDGRISFTPERDVYFRMCENKALDAAERGGCQMPLRPGSGPSSSPSGLTPSGLDLCRATGPLIHLVPASRGKRVHVSGSQKLVCVSHNQKAVVWTALVACCAFLVRQVALMLLLIVRVRSLSK